MLEYNVLCISKIKLKVAHGYLHTDDKGHDMYSLYKNLHPNIS